MPIFHHSLIHTILVMVILVFYVADLRQIIIGSTIILVSHFLIDVWKGRMNTWFPSLQNPVKKFHWWIFGLDQALQRLALPLPADIIECSSVYSMQQLIQLTDAIMVLSETALRDYLKMGLVVALPVELDVQMAPFGLLLRKGKHISRELGLFIELLRRKVAVF